MGYSSMEYFAVLTVLFCSLHKELVRREMQASVSLMEVSQVEDKFCAKKHTYPILQ